METQLELLEKLSAIIPQPRQHLVLWTGVFSSHSSLRSMVVLKPDKRKGFHYPSRDDEPGLVKNYSWSKMLEKNFGLDLSICPSCGGEMQIMCRVADQDGIERYLKHLNLEHHPPPIAPARYQARMLEFEQEPYVDDVPAIEI